MVLLAVSLSTAQLTEAAGVETTPFIKSIDRMMVALAPNSARASKTITQSYRRHMDLLVLDAYAELEGALATGGVVYLPADPLRFNLNPRVAGLFPIGEKDLLNQESYLAARPETLGALIEVASRVKSGPLEVTSLVRHSEYQETLKKTNGNANTSVPMHTMGLAFDIALINTPLATIYEIRDVLEEMQAAGDLLVIGERQQLVFHVVPHPSRLGHFMDVYARAIADITPGANVIAPPPLEDVGTRELVAAVSTEVIAVRPTESFAKEWWASDDTHSDVVVSVSPLPSAPAIPSTSLFERVAVRCQSLFSSLLNTMNGLLS
jgi:hypothetical protein